MPNCTKISVIICTLNRPDDLRRTIEYINDSDNPPEQIIIIDQTSDDDLLQRYALTIRNYTNIKYIHIDTKSSTLARNIGIENAVSPIIIFMDDDVDVRHDTFDIIRKEMDSVNTALLGAWDSNQLYSRNNNMGALFLKSSLFHKNKAHITKGIYGRLPEYRNMDAQADWAMGYFFVVRKELLEQSGIRFDENLKYYAYAEDLDFTIRYCRYAHTLGLVTKFPTKLIVNHRESPLQRTDKSDLAYFIILHRYYLSHKLFHGIGARIAFAWSVIGDIISSITSRYNTNNIIKAIRYCILHRNQIKTGNIDYSGFIRR